MPPAAVAHVAAPALPAPRTRRRERKKGRVAGGVVWIAVVAALLAGVVAMNVAVLRLNVENDKLGRERAALLSKKAEVASQLSSAAATARIQDLARKQGLVPARPDETTYLRLGR
jgi:cell division protein FtsL